MIQPKSYLQNVIAHQCGCSNHYRYRYFYSCSSWPLPNTILMSKYGAFTFEHTVPASLLGVWGGVALRLLMWMGEWGIAIMDRWIGEGGLIYDYTKVCPSH